MARAAKTPSVPVVGKFADKQLSEHLQLVYQRLRQVVKADGAQSERVHQTRVASRRARAAIDLFASLLADRHAQWFRKQLRRIRKAADEARNLDVCLARWQSTGVQLPPDVRKLFTTARAQAQLPLQQVEQRLRADRKWESKLRKLRRRLKEKQSSKRWSKSTSNFAMEALQPLVAEFVTACQTRDTSAAQLHQLRIDSKRFRYALELLQPALPQRITATLLTQLTRLQDELGAINDHATAAKLLATIAGETKTATIKNWLRLQLRSERNAFSQARTKFLRGWTTKRRGQFRRWCALIIRSPEPKSKSSVPRKPRS